MGLGVIHRKSTGRNYPGSDVKLDGPWYFIGQGFEGMWTNWRNIRRLTKKQARV